MLQLILKLLKLFAPVISLAISPTAYAGLFGFGSTNWQEEIQLHDAKKLVVNRSVTRGGPHEIGQRSSYTKETLAFIHPTTGRSVVWEDKASKDIGTSSFLPMALDIYGNTVYLVVNPMGCLAYNKHGRPNPPYVVFKYSGETWERVALHELPAETKSLNLIFSSPDTEVERLGKRFVDTETIKHINDEHSQPEYRSILRETIAEPAGRCGEMISDGQGGWIGIGWFKKQPSREACLNFCAQEKIGIDHCPCKSMFQDKQP